MFEFDFWFTMVALGVTFVMAFLKTRRRRHAFVDTKTFRLGNALASGLLSASLAFRAFLERDHAAIATLFGLLTVSLAIVTYSILAKKDIYKDSL